MFDISSFFNAVLIDFGLLNGIPQSSENLSKIRFGPLRPPRDAKGRPEASREPFSGLQGAMLESFWVPYLDHLGDMCGHFPTQVTCKPCRSCYYSSPGFQGRRVPALAPTISQNVGEIYNFLGGILPYGYVTIMSPEVGPTAETDCIH